MKVKMPEPRQVKDGTSLFDKNPKTYFNMVSYLRDLFYIDIKHNFEKIDNKIIEKVKFHTT